MLTEMLIMTQLDTMLIIAFFANNGVWSLYAFLEKNWENLIISHVLERCLA